MFEAVRRAHDVGVHHQRHDASRARRVTVELFELIDRPVIILAGLVMLDQHHRDVVAFLRIGDADGLRQQASVEDVDYRAPRGLDRSLFHKLTNGEWIDAHDNLILCGPTGVGKSWLACALGHKACRDNRSVLYQRVPKLFAELALARGDGRYARILRGLTGVQLLILDDWGLEPLDAGARRDLYEILEERYGRRSTILTSPQATQESCLTKVKPAFAGKPFNSPNTRELLAESVISNWRSGVTF